VFLGGLHPRGIDCETFHKVFLAKEIIFAIIFLTHDLACLPAANRILSGNLQTV
jgi:hypothetical protein